MKKEESTEDWETVGVRSKLTLGYLRSLGWVGAEGGGWEGGKCLLTLLGGGVGGGVDPLLLGTSLFNLVFTNQFVIRIAEMENSE